MARLVGQLVVPPDALWCHPSYDVTFGSAINHDLSRLVARRYDRPGVTTNRLLPDTIQCVEVSGVHVAESHDLSCDRSVMATTSRTISYDGYSHRTSPTLIARPRVWPIARWPTTSQNSDGSMDRFWNRTIRCDCGLKSTTIALVLITFSTISLLSHQFN